MEKFLALVEESLNIDLVSIIISNPRQAGEITKIKIRPVLIKDCLYFQAESFTKRQAFHKNLTKEGIMELFEGYIRDYKQMEIVTKTQTIHGLISKKGKITVKRKKIGGCQKSLSHNRKKRYIIDEGTKVQFLIDLGVMTKEGKIVRTKYDKFRQINRFLEFIEDILPDLPKGRELTIIDFGCGKSYLTFAVHYLLTQIKGISCQIEGLDLKEDVIKYCNDITNKLELKNLIFHTGNISDYSGKDNPDIVITLHACDTATDFALQYAVERGAKAILSVPCCQHQINQELGKQKKR